PLPAPPSAGGDAAPVAAAVTPLPSGLWRAALAQVGGWSSPADGGVAASRDTHDAWVSAGYQLAGWRWWYGAGARAHFPPHAERDGQRYATLTDPGLRADPEHTSLVGPYYQPGDHDGCRCDRIDTWTAPGGAP
ncbi:MAG: hypothetical protein ACRCZP_17695, partial [Phycicoccus sp.]